MSDRSILEHVNELVEEERRLRDATPDDHAQRRLASIETELDQCWDLLRQRRARQEFGEDPDAAQVRDPRTVKGYIG